MPEEAAVAAQDLADRFEVEAGPPHPCFARALARPGEEPHIGEVSSVERAIPPPNAG